MWIDGQCHCGAIAYSAEADPDEVSICYCSDCQKFTGSAYRVSVTVRASDFVLRAGQPRYYVKIADSGARRVQAFCPNCGAPIYSSAEVDPQTYSLRVGGLRQRDELPPKRQIWMRSKPTWLEPFPGLEAFETDGPQRKKT